MGSEMCIRDRVRIHELRPLTLEEAIQLAEFNSPKLKAAASQVDQAKSALRAVISAKRDQRLGTKLRSLHGVQTWPDPLDWPQL